MVKVHIAGMITLPDTFIKCLDLKQAKTTYVLNLKAKVLHHSDPNASFVRVNDNLEKNISSFYTELLRIKTIVQAADKGDNILFLLDEIFKGTNSQERHDGATILIKKLSKMGAVGLVSTHDLELGALASEQNLAVENYHFSEHYANNETLIMAVGATLTLTAIFITILGANLI